MVHIFDNGFYRTSWKQPRVALARPTFISMLEDLAATHNNISWFAPINNKRPILDSNLNRIGLAPNPHRLGDRWVMLYIVLA